MSRLVPPLCTLTDPQPVCRRIGISDGSRPEEERDPARLNTIKRKRYAVLDSVHILRPTDRSPLARRGGARMDRRVLSRPPHQSIVYTPPACSIPVSLLTTARSLKRGRRRMRMKGRAFHNMQTGNFFPSLSRPTVTETPVQPQTGHTSSSLS